MTYPGGATKSFDYDPLMRVESITSKDPGQNVLMNLQYGHGKMDNITSKNTEHGNYGSGSLASTLMQRPGTIITIIGIMIHPQADI